MNKNIKFVKFVIYHETNESVTFESTRVVHEDNEREEEREMVEMLLPKMLLWRINLCVRRKKLKVSNIEQIDI